MVKKITDWSPLIPFLSSPHDEFHLADLARRLAIRHTTLRLKLAPFVAEGLLQLRRRGNLSCFRLNHDHPCLADHLLLAEKRRLVERSAAEPLIAELVTTLSRLLPDGAIALLFGSAVTRSDPKDLDLLLVGAGRVSLEAFERRYHMPVHLIKGDRLDRITPALRQEIVKNHLLLRGSEDAIRWLLWSRSTGAGGRGTDSA